MGNIQLHLASQKSLYLFSSDIVRSCQVYARQAEDSTNLLPLAAANIGCVFVAGSFIEARLNEITATVTTISGGSDKLPADFWETLHADRKNLTYIQKWNLIATSHGGLKWDHGKEPFQSHDLLISLRNELVHYKGNFGDGVRAPAKKINHLLKSLGAHQPDDQQVGASWVNSLLDSRGLSRWISRLICDLDMKCEHMLTGREFTDQDRILYELRQANYEVRARTL